MKMEQAKCPLCGGELSYEPSEYDDECELTKWRCDKCGATGTEVCDIKFALHQDVKDADGNPVQIHVPSDMFWVTFLANNKNGLNYCLGVNNAYSSLKEARQEVEWREETLGKDLVAVWVERHNDGKRIDIPFHKVYVDALGFRRR